MIFYFDIELIILTILEKYDQQHYGTRLNICSFVFSFDVKTSVKIIDIQRLFIITADRPNRGTTIDD